MDIRTAEGWHLFATNRLREREADARERKAENAYDALTMALVDGLRSAMHAHPDCFSPFGTFDAQEAANYLASWIAARPR